MKLGNFFGREFKPFSLCFIDLIFAVENFFYFVCFGAFVGFDNHEGFWISCLEFHESLLGVSLCVPYFVLACTVEYEIDFTHVDFISITEKVS